MRGPQDDLNANVDYVWFRNYAEVDLEVTFESEKQSWQLVGGLERWTAQATKHWQAFSVYVCQFGGCLVLKCSRMVLVLCEKVAYR